MARYELIATAAMGLEALVARELKQLGYEDQLVENGRVTFYGDERDICRTNLWLRTAGRILIKLGEFQARTFDDLFEGVKALPWSRWIPRNGEFPVNGRSHKSQLSSVPACQGVVKKAIVESMKQSYRNEWFPEDGPRYEVEIALLHDQATLTIDTTGDGLHKRGYRLTGTEAPLRESLAAAMILLSRWKPERPLYDPLCGSGTIAIEAAMIGRNIAPGLRRGFRAEAWPNVPSAFWAEARDQAREAIRRDVALRIAGSDRDRDAIDIAGETARNAGLSGDVTFRRIPIEQADPQGEYGCIITNPPYGERIGSLKEVEAVNRGLGRIAERLPTWSHFIITPDRNFEALFGRKADKKRKLYNGQIECALHQYLGPFPGK